LPAGRIRKISRGGGFKLKDTKRISQLLDWLKILETKFDFVGEAVCAQAFLMTVTSQRAFDIFSKAATAKTFYRCKKTNEYKALIESHLK
jgi:hypothetical protein